MVSVQELLHWKLPPALIMLVVLLQLAAKDDRRLEQQLDFVEVFAGQAAVTEALRSVPCCSVSACFGPKAGFHGVAMDYEYDASTQNLLTDAGFLLLGVLCGNAACAKDGPSADPPH